MMVCVFLYDDIDKKSTIDYHTVSYFYIIFVYQFSMNFFSPPFSLSLSLSPPPPPPPPPSLHTSSQENDPSLTEVNFNNHRGLDSDLMNDVLDALDGNNFLEELLLSNVKMDEKHAIVCF